MTENVPYHLKDINLAIMGELTEQSPKLRSVEWGKKKRQKLVAHTLMHTFLHKLKIKNVKKIGNCELCNKHYSREKHRMSNEDWGRWIHGSGGWVIECQFCKGVEEEDLGGVWQ